MASRARIGVGQGMEGLAGGVMLALVGAGAVAGGLGYWLGGKNHRVLGTALGIGAGIGGYVGLAQLLAGHVSTTPPAPEGTMLLHGATVAITAPIPAGVSDPQALTASLEAAGWSNVTVQSWGPTDTANPSTFYIAHGTWTGPTQSVPAGMNVK